MPLSIEMRGYGPPEVLEAVEREPVAPGPEEVVVTTDVAGVNRADLFIRSGEWEQSGGWPYVPGLEVAGTVARAGSEVAGLRPGDEVISMMQGLGGIHGERRGGYQEEVVVPADTLARVPGQLGVELAGALGLPAVTAALAVRALALEPGMRVLVHAGSSAVGSIALQLLRNADAVTVATGTSPEKFELMRDFGADLTVDTKDSDWPRTAGPVDRVLDLVGRATFAETVGLLQPGGRLLFVGGTTGAELAFSGWDLMKPITLTGFSTESLTRDELQRTLGALAAGVATERLRVADLHSFPLREAAAAHAAMQAGHLAGRVVLRAGTGAT